MRSVHTGINYPEISHGSTCPCWHDHPPTIPLNLQRKLSLSLPVAPQKWRTKYSSRRNRGQLALSNQGMRPDLLEFRVHFALQIPFEHKPNPSFQVRSSYNCVRVFIRNATFWGGYFYFASCTSHTIHIVLFLHSVACAIFRINGEDTQENIIFNIKYETAHWLTAICLDWDAGVTKHCFDL